jgi:2-oxoglutarate/2-oxoacid ferredoxin oxidoreductase subunit beta
VHADFVPPATEITTEYAEGAVRQVPMHDGSIISLRKLAQDYDPTNRDLAYAYVRQHQEKGEVLTGLLYLNPDSSDVHDQNDIIPTPLTRIPYEQLCPGNAELQKLQNRFR